MIVLYNTQLSDPNTRKKILQTPTENQIQAGIKNLISMKVDILVLARQCAHVRIL